MDQNSRNPKGRYPLCKPSVGGVACERCGLELRDQRPCPAVDPNERWGPDYEKKLDSILRSQNTTSFSRLSQIKQK